MMSTPDPMTAEELRTERRALGFSQARLAMYAKVHVSTIARYEQGRRTVGPDMRAVLEGIKSARRKAGLR